MLFKCFLITYFIYVTTVYTFGTYWKKNGHETGICATYNNKFLSLLNLLCNSTQTTSIQQRDACYGCFFRSGGLPNGQTQLVTLSQCANLYLVNTSYAICATDLSLIINGIRPTTPPTLSGSCYTGYCDFVRCVRRVNSNLLIDTCFMRSLVGRNLTILQQRVDFYTNVTSCILARTRCNQYNPISGELQNDANNVLQKQQQINSLQITPNGDIRIITFPSAIINNNVGQLFCSRMTNLDQSIQGSDYC